MDTTEFYRGFRASIRYSYATRVYTGEIEGLTAPYVFQASTYLDAQQSFRTIVDDHLNSGQVVAVEFARWKAEESA